jgi:hypothetical protein
MASIIRLKRSTTPGSVPTTSDLSLGEIAINVHDGKVFLRRSGSVDDIREVLTNEYTGSVAISLVQLPQLNLLEMVQDLLILQFHKLQQLDRHLQEQLGQ